MYISTYLLKLCITYVYTCVYTNVHICTNLYMYIHTYIYIYTHTWIYTHAYSRTHTSTHTYICAYIYQYSDEHIYTVQGADACTSSSRAHCCSTCVSAARELHRPRDSPKTGDLPLTLRTIKSLNVAQYQHVLCCAPSHVYACL